STSDSLNSARFDCELRMRHRNDSYRWMHCSGRLEIDADGNLVRLAGSLVDVTKGKVRDVLTGLPNRLLFEEQLSKVLHLNHDEYGLNAVLFLDLDDFKRINDNYGHDAGDLLLCTVARKLEGCLRGSDVIARQKSCWSIARLQVLQELRHPFSPILKALRLAIFCARQWRRVTLTAL
ncbi:MAG: diguanylate cyclase, partial [Planctomycetota bacterium]